MQWTIANCDILDRPADVLVVSANPQLNHSGEAGRFQLDNHLSRPGDCNRYLARIMTRVKNILIVVAVVMILVALLLPPVANVPAFMLASPPTTTHPIDDGVVVFVSQSEMSESGDFLDVTLTVLNKTGQRIYFSGQSPRFGYIFPAYAKDVENDIGFAHCGNCWKQHSIIPGFGTTFKSTLHTDEKRGRYGFRFGYDNSGPSDQISWSENIAFPDGAR